MRGALTAGQGVGQRVKQRPMLAERYYDLLSELAERLVGAEADLRRAATRAPTTAGREEALAAADGLSAERRRLRVAVAREEERRTEWGSARPVLRDPVAIGSLVIDPLRRRVAVEGDEVRLSAKEFSLLRVLASEPTRVFTKQELLRDVWGYHGTTRTRTLDSHASRLRGKLNGASDRHFVLNVWGVGYRLVDEHPEPVGE